MLAMVAADPSKAACQVPADQEFVHYLGDDGAQATVTGLVLVRINLLKLAIVPVGALPKRRLSGIVRAIRLHTQGKSHHLGLQPRHGDGPLCPLEPANHS